MRKTPTYADGNTRDPRNPPDDDPNDTKAAEHAIDAADRAGKGQTG